MMKLPLFMTFIVFAGFTACLPVKAQDISNQSDEEVELYYPPPSRYGERPLRLDGLMPLHIKNQLPLDKFWDYRERTISFSAGYWKKETSHESESWETRIGGTKGVAISDKDRYPSGFSSSILVSQVSNSKAFQVVLFVFYNSKSDTAAYIIAHVSAFPDTKKATIRWSSPVIHSNPDKTELAKVFPLDYQPYKKGDGVEPTETEGN